ncbi:hypothetical protein GQ53DRAFT_768085 [Thozetella sp. PMI_491]|nr:hypothetical protein GQ53DRAFT_768085 [Thozetella sp. PMI_491]
MFSPSVQEGGPARGTRSSRRRQRPLSSDSLVQQPKAKRQRVPLSENTFVNPDAPPETFEVKPDKVDFLGIKRDGVENFGAPRKELSVRSKKPKPGERLGKGDGSVVLTTNAAYTVSKLPALPDRIRADSQNRQHGAIYSPTGYALSLTHTHALVWPYTSTTASPETFTFALPYPSKHAADPLPLGSLVSPPASSEEPGLVVVMPVSGKISFWESISSAATLDFIRQQRSGVEDTIHGMFSGEHVIQIVDAESAGFILVFSSGRLAYMSVRDSHGRPAISVQFLRNGLGNASGGFLGSIRHALTSSSIRAEIAAVKASQGTQIGERIVVAATSKGKLHSWKLHRGGHYDALAEVDVREDVAKALLQQAGLSTAKPPQDTLEVLDFAFVPRGLEKKYVEMNRLNEALSSGDELLQHLVLLVSIAGQRRQARYALVEIVLSVTGYRLGMLRLLTSYTSPARATALERPRIYLPRPGIIAFIVFDRAVVIASIASLPDSPDSQLREDSHILPAAFEDVIDFRDEDTLQIIGSGVEEPTGNNQDDTRSSRHRTKNPAAVLLVQGVGALRISIADVDRFASERPPEVTAKSKLEQAVFFGVKDDNPLVFQGRRALPFASKDIGDAAIQLSHEIVASKTSFISGVPASLENNMKTRSMYLDRLIAHLNALEVDLDRRTRWMLLYNAEKMNVATHIWQENERFLAERPKNNKKNLVTETIMYIHEQQKTEANPEIGEVDPVRHWFINDVWRLDIFIAWAYQMIKYAYTGRGTDESGINRLLYEAVTINSLALAKAHEYRQQVCHVYGLKPADTPEGDAMPEPWTSSQYITNNLKRLIEFCYQWLDTHYSLDAGSPKSSVEPGPLEVIRNTLPSLTGEYFTTLKEYAQWASNSRDSRTVELAKVCQETLAARDEKILKLKDYDLWDEAVALAKEYRSYRAMAQLIVDQIEAYRQGAALRGIPPAQVQEHELAAKAKEEQLGDLFDQFGLPFASAAYEVLLNTCGVQAVLDFKHDKKGFVTNFLRTRPELAKISWINDVQREADIDHAAESLLDLGLTREQQVWNKKIELSLSKLALMAEETQRSATSDSSSSENEIKKGANLDKVDRELEIIKIQDDLYGQILPSCQDAVDAAAELEFAMKEHAVLIPKKQKALNHVFEESMARLLRHEALDASSLIDLLTLAYLDLKHHDAIGYQFDLALKVASLALKGEELSSAQRLIWRRCYIRDDWKRVNETNMKDDLDQLAVLGETAAYHTLYSIVADPDLDKDSWPTVKPSEALGVFTERLDRRFDDMDDSVRGMLLDAMRWEDAKLRAFIEKNRLDEWYFTTLEVARNTVNYKLRETDAAQADREVNGGVTSTL